MIVAGVDLVRQSSWLQRFARISSTGFDSAALAGKTPNNIILSAHAARAFRISDVLSSRTIFRYFIHFLFSSSPPPRLMDPAADPFPVTSWRGRGQQRPRGRDLGGGREVLSFSRDSQFRFSKFWSSKVASAPIVLHN